MDVTKFWSKALSITNDSEFTQLALELFHYQSRHVEVYRQFLELLNVDISKINTVAQIPFLPVQLFKTHIITDQLQSPDFFFTSSGTTGQVTSRHFVADKSIYDESLLRGFKMFYGDPSPYCFLALLPGYLERSGSSLVYMFQKLIDSSTHPESGFYLHNHEELQQKLLSLQQRNVPVFLIGVSYALLDLFEKNPLQLSGAIIMETGGMKGKRKEMVRVELHRVLSEKTGAKKIHSEYGMTELLSQAYSHGDGIFKCPPWMKITIQDIHDPFQQLTPGETGSINVIDLANIHSCAFIATQDLGRVNTTGEFEVLGRMDNSELRGCNLMIG